MAESAMDRLYKQLQIMQGYKQLFEPSASQVRKQQGRAASHMEHLRYNLDTAETQFDNTDLEKTYQDVKQYYANNYRNMDEATRISYQNAEGELKDLYDKNNLFENEWDSFVGMQGMKEDVIGTLNAYYNTTHNEIPSIFTQEYMVDPISKENKRDEDGNLMKNGFYQSWLTKYSDGTELPEPLKFADLNKDQQNQLNLGREDVKTFLTNELRSHSKEYVKWYQNMVQRFPERFPADSVNKQALDSHNRLMANAVMEIQDQGGFDKDEREVLINSIEFGDPSIYENYYNLQDKSIGHQISQQAETMQNNLLTLQMYYKMRLII